jgi:ZIP family zinc transporter
VLEAFLTGLIAASSLVVGGVIAIRWSIGHHLLGIVMAFGAGVLISSVAYELVGEAAATSAGQGGVGLGMLAGALTFFVGDLLIDRLGGANRKSPDREGGGAGLAIVLGTVLDGLPESVVLGVGLIAATESSPALLIAVFISNVPEAIAATAGLRRDGWSSSRLLLMWGAIAVVSAFAAVVGYVLFDGAAPAVIAFVLAFAGGAVLTMLADTMMPEAYEHAGSLVGVVTTIGFGVGFWLAAV